MDNAPGSDVWGLIFHVGKPGETCVCVQRSCCLGNRYSPLCEHDLQQAQLCPSVLEVLPKLVHPQGFLIQL